MKDFMLAVATILTVLQALFLGGLLYVAIFVAWPQIQPHYITFIQLKPKIEALQSAADKYTQIVSDLSYVKEKVVIFENFKKKLENLPFLEEQKATFD